MNCIRITSHDAETGRLYAEHLYLIDSQTKAIDRFRREYPEHKDCIVVAEDYDANDPKNVEHFKACLRCECVH